MTLLILFSILVIHWFADFVLQTHYQAIGKSAKWKPLLEHTAIYTMMWIPFIVLYILFGTDEYIRGHFTLFLIITFVAHTLTDYFTSRWVRYYFSRNNFHNGFVIIGIDQILHYTQLILCVKFLFL